MEKNFTDCSLLACQWMPCTQILTFTNSHIAMKFVSFSLESFRYTIVVLFLGSCILGNELYSLEQLWKCLNGVGKVVLCVNEARETWEGYNE